MPVYVYACQSCGRQFEHRQGFQDPPLAECEACGGELRRLLQPVGVIFRGSGFYTTDYGGGRRNGAPRDPGSTSAADPTSASVAGAADQAGSSSA